MSSSLKRLVLRPHRFLLARPTRIMMLLYGSTYLTANLVDTMSSVARNQPASTTTSGLAKFGAVSLVNVSRALYKDSQFTQMFGTIAARPLPPTSYMLLAFRDSITIFASFNLPPKVAPMLPTSVEHHFSRPSVAQFTVPALAQLFEQPPSLARIGSIQPERHHAGSRSRAESTAGLAHHQSGKDVQGDSCFWDRRNGEQ